MKNYMNIFLLYALLFCFSKMIYAEKRHINMVMRNYALRCFIVKQKKIPILMNKFKNFYKLCYEKTLSSISDGVINYNQLSDDEKTLIEAVISLAY
jgi:hypothetical protein